jgi:uncharacterized protein YbjT (DUF2867 family)
MKVLLTGVNSYIGLNLIPALLENGHQVVCIVRDKDHFIKNNKFSERVTLLKGDLLRIQSMEALPVDIDGAYYLTNTKVQTSAFAGLEALCAQNFIEAIGKTNCTQIITISEINKEGSALDYSRRHVEQILSQANVALTVFKTNMVIGPGSIAIEMFKALTESNPVIIARNWSKTHSQPIALIDVLAYLELSLLNRKTFNGSFELCGPEVLNYKQMLLNYGEIFKTQRPRIVSVPYVSSKLSLYLLNLLTPISFTMANNLIESLKYDTICKDNSIKEIIPRDCLTFKKALKQASLATNNITAQLNVQ